MVCGRFHWDTMVFAANLLHRFEMDSRRNHPKKDAFLMSILIANFAAKKPCLI